MKSAGHSAIISNILMWIPRSIVRVYPSVSPHMGLFLATENCVVLRFCAWAGGAGASVESMAKTETQRLCELNRVYCTALST